MKRRPLVTFVGLVALAALGAGSYRGYHGWQTRPKPHFVTFQLKEPGRTEIEAEEEAQRAPKPLAITFSESVAPLAAVGKTVPNGISLEPALPGLWLWQSDRRLTFLPKEDWPIGAVYKVRFQAPLFKPNVRLEKEKADFRAPTFDVRIEEARFYQDPLKSDLKKAIVNLTFSYPVNPAELEKRIQLKLGEKENLKFAVTYDPFKLKAFIQSEALPIPQEETALSFKLAKGAMPLKGGNTFSQDLERRLSIPGLYSLGLTDLRTQVVTNTRDEPEQVLTIDASADLDTSELSKSISVWVLPKFALDHKPTEGEKELPFAWSETDVTPEVLNKSVQISPEAIPNEEEHSTIQNYRYRAEVGDRLFIRVKQGLRSFGGYLLAKDVVRVLEVPAYPADLKIMSKGALLALSGEKKIGIMARDLPGIKIEIGRVLPSQIQHLVSQSSQGYADPQFYGRFKSDSIVERFERKLPLPKLTRGQAHYESLDLTEYLRAPGAEEKRGVFLVTTRGYDPVKEEREAKRLAKQERQLGAPPMDPDEYLEEMGEGYEGSEESEGSVDPETIEDIRMVLVTDLGIIVKEWLDGTQEIYVQSIYSGLPVAGAKVEIMGKNGGSLFSQVTDAEGRARFAKIENLSREHKPTLILVQKDDDLSFMPLSLTKDGLDLSRFDVGGSRNAMVPDQVKAFLFSDRGIYRPGDTFHVGAIVKPARWETNVVGLPLLIETLDSRGLILRSEKIQLPASGFFEFSQGLEESAPAGIYYVNLYLIKDDKAGLQIGSTHIRVQEFLPDRMKVTAKLSADSGEGWVSPESLKALVEAQNLFGTPAENRRVTGEISLSPAFPAFSAHADYAFYDPHRAKEGYTEALGDGKTDAQGKAEFDLRLGKYAKATYRLSFVAEVFEPEGGRSVAASATSLVSDLAYLIGFKADGSLEYISRGDKRGVSLIAIDPKLQKIAVGDLILQRIETLHVSVLSKQVDGTYGYESRKKEVKISESPLEIPTAGYVLALDTAEPGDFSYRVLDAQGSEINRIDYSVAGRGNVTRNLERNAELKLTLNKKEYAPGEDIEVSIRAPYVGAGLITIERDKVDAVQWFKADTLASVQKIRVPQGFEGNGYVSVQFIRDPGSDEIFMSPLSYGVAPFSGSLEGRSNRLKLTAPERIKPGETLNIQLEAEKPTKAVVFAVDEGILQVASYRLPKPLAFFFQKKMLEVRTSQILDMIVPEFKKLLLPSAPGGDAEEGLAKRLNPFKRKREKPVVYWSGIVEVNGRGEFAYPVPGYFNGGIRIMAVSVNESSIGATQAQTLVRGDLIISPNAPTTITPGDEFEVSVGVSNNVAGSGAKAPISLTLKTPPQLEILGDPTQALEIGEMREGVATYRIKAVAGKKAQLGSAALIFTATLGEKSAELFTDISVRPATPRYTQLQMGSFSERAEVPIQRDLYPQYRRLEAGVSLLPLVFASGLSQYLSDYEHLCTEQLVSQAMPAIVLDHRPEFGATIAKPPRSFAETLDFLRTRQNAEGGFGVWNASIQPDEFTSVYAFHMMLEAQERGQAVPSDMLQSGLDYLKKFSASPGQSLWELRNRAYATYLLTRREVVTTPLLTSLRETLEKRYPKEWKSDLAGIYLAASYQLLQQGEAAHLLLEEGFGRWNPQSPETAFEYGDFYDPLIRDAQVLYLLSRHFPEKAKALPPTAMSGLVKSISEGRFNTLSAAYLILAFDAYAQQIGAAGLGKVGITEVDAQGLAKAVELPANLIPRAPFSPEARRLQMSNTSGLAAYYAVSESGFDKSPPTSELRQGIEVQREYLDAAGKPVTSLAVGDEITVRIRYRTVDRKALGDGALIDLLPGGFEPVLSPAAENQGNAGLGGLSGLQAPAGIQFAEAREDRVLFYGSIPSDLGELSYRIKATNAGRFMVPPAYAESMYDRGIQARSIGGQTLTVAPAPVTP